MWKLNKYELTVIMESADGRGIERFPACIFFSTILPILEKNSLIAPYSIL